ncbi:hypothetical protein ZIOFF_069105 [Zingiber officinale]|uniref:Uncharacterized protein n=1 Tax=Zingiber officinale TaxID=94328 RepID=A0A8J5CAH8_ZINOF|nr:hypothetical protein ZIOFF_069105 [Zingiber officinale]
MGIYDAMKLCKADIATVCLVLRHQWVLSFLLLEQKERDSACQMLKSRSISQWEVLEANLKLTLLVEAKEYGLVDIVIDDGKPGLVAPIGDSALPPRTLIWDSWTDEEMKKSKQNLPSEEKLLQNGNKIGGRNDEVGKEQPKEKPTTV